MMSARSSLDSPRSAGLSPPICPQSVRNRIRHGTANTRPGATASGRGKPLRTARPPCRAQRRSLPARRAARQSDRNPLAANDFFFEPGEARRESGAGPRVVRVGSHALMARSRATLRQRLRQHYGTARGQYPGGGNHRGSIFRLRIGQSLLARASRPHPTWGCGATAPRAVREAEHSLECEVSAALRLFHVLCLRVDGGTDGGRALRARIESNSLALLSNRCRSAAIDPPSATWLGLHSPADPVAQSGLWNTKHVDGAYDATFLDQLDALWSARPPRVDGVQRTGFGAARARRGLHPPYTVLWPGYSSPARRDAGRTPPIPARRG